MHSLEQKHNPQLHHQEPFISIKPLLQNYIKHDENGLAYVLYTMSFKYMKFLVFGQISIYIYILYIDKSMPLEAIYISPVTCKCTTKTPGALTDLQTRANIFPCPGPHHVTFHYEDFK